MAGFIHADGLRLYGTGIASSATESRFRLGRAPPSRLVVGVGRVLRTRAPTRWSSVERLLQRVDQPAHMRHRIMDGLG